MKVAEVCWGEAEFAACEPPAFDHSLRAQMIQVFRDAFAEGDVAYALLQVAPGMINVHSIFLLFLTPHGGASWLRRAAIEAGA